MDYVWTLGAGLGVLAFSRGMSKWHGRRALAIRHMTVPQLLAVIQAHEGPDITTDELLTALLCDPLIASAAHQDLDRLSQAIERVNDPLGLEAYALVTLYSAVYHRIGLADTFIIIAAEAPGAGEQTAPRVEPLKPRAGAVPSPLATHAPERGCEKNKVVAS